ncbi:MAG: hypothetical protein AB8I08_14415, partial [Sandaracinaceae bacterium]
HCSPDTYQPPSAPGCEPYACSGTAAACPTSCTTHDDCAASDPRYVCVAGSCIRGRLAFVTSTNYPEAGLIGSQANADVICQSHASIAGFPGAYRAWLSTARSAARDRFGATTLPYVLRVGATGRTILADNWSDLTDGTLDTPFGRDEQGNPVDAGVWTGTSFVGGSTGADCGEWSSSAGTATVGNTVSTNSNWTAVLPSAPCTWTAGPRRLYCLEIND